MSTQGNRDGSENLDSMDIWYLDLLSSCVALGESLIISSFINCKQYPHFGTSSTLAEGSGKVPGTKKVPDRCQCETFYATWGIWISTSDFPSLKC